MSILPSKPTFELLLPINSCCWEIQFFIFISPYSTAIFGDKKSSLKRNPRLLSSTVHFTKKAIF